MRYCCKKRSHSGSWPHGLRGSAQWRGIEAVGACSFVSLVSDLGEGVRTFEWRHVC